MENEKEYFPGEESEEYPKIDLVVTKKRFGPQGGHRKFQIDLSLWDKEDIPYKASRKNRGITILCKRHESEDLWRCMGFWFFWRWVRINCAGGRSKIGAIKLGKRVSMPLGYSYTRMPSITIVAANLEELIENNLLGSS